MTMAFRQICWTLGTILFISFARSSCQEEMLDNSVNSPVSRPMPHMPPLAVISDEPLSLAKSMAKVPLVAVPQKDLIVMKNAEITTMSPDNALVQCFNDRTGLTEAMPAVKMYLRTPVFINAGLGRQVVDFPSFVNVVHRGSLVPLHVGALIAPIVNYQRLSQPVLVKMVYAVPTFPLNYQYGPPSLPAASPYTRPFHLFQPYPLAYNLYNQPYINYRPYGAIQPISDAGALPPKQPSPVAPLQPAVAPATIKQPTSPYSQPQDARPQSGQPLVTVLDFPSAVASPSVLYYQPPLGPDTEFENREPPQPVIPAGIIQSTAPQSNQQLFMNSKESVYLVSIKEDLKRL